MGMLLLQNSAMDPGKAYNRLKIKKVILYHKVLDLSSVLSKVLLELN